MKQIEALTGRKLRAGGFREIPRQRIYRPSRKDLDSSRFPTREAARKALEDAGEFAEAQLQAQLRKEPWNSERGRLPFCVVDVKRKKAHLAADLVSPTG